jgi:hypothetical protein
MSRDLTGAASYLSRNDRLGLAGYPLSVFVRFYGDTFATNNRALFNLGQAAGAADDSLKLAVLTDARVEVMAYDPVNGFRVAQSVATVSTGAWQSAGAVWASATSRSVYVNGANKVTNTQTSAVTFTDLDRTGVGVNIVGGFTELFDGRLAHPTVWKAELTDDEFAALHAGIHPTRIRPASLVSYWSLSGKDSPEIDIVGRYDLTVTNAAASIEEPRVYRAFAP